MKQFCLLLALLSFACVSTYAQDIFFNAYSNGRALTANGTTVTNLPIPKAGGDANDYVEILSYQYGFSNTTTNGAGTGSGAGKTIASVIELTKRLDVSTSILLPYLLAGRHIDFAELIIRKASGGKAADALIATIELKNVLLSNYTSSASQSGDCCPAEGLSLSYTAIRIINYQQDQTGKVTPQTPVVWNFALNEASY